MRKSTKRIFAVIVMALMLAMYCVEAFAAGLIETDRNCSLKIEYVDDKTPIPNAEFRIYKVADVTETGKMTLCGRFKDYPISLEVEESSDWLGIATALKGYVQVDKIEAMDSGKTDGSGKISFPTPGKTLKPGLYLVLGDPVTVDDKYIYSATPFMVLLPGLDEKDERVYDLTVFPKSTKQETEPTVVKTLRKVIKEWDDEGFESIRPTEVTVQLLCDGEVYDTQKLNKENDWRYTWDELERDHDWNIVEKEVDGYTVTIEKAGVTFNVKNTYKTTPEPETTSRKVVKIWDDAGHESERPNEVTVYLFRDGELFDTKTLNGAGNWEYTWDGLEADREYTVAEQAIDGYSTRVTRNGGTFTITNIYVETPPEEKTTLKATKIWNDAGYENKRPSEVTVSLICDGKVFDTQKLTAANGWQHVWTDLEKGHEWDLTEKEIDGYDSNVIKTEESFIIVNIYNRPVDPGPGPEPEKTEVRAVKIWEDAGNESKRPAEVTVYLLRDGEAYDSQKLNGANGWEYIWTELDASHEWTVVEKPVNNYGTVISKNGKFFVIVNTYEAPDELTPETTSRKVVMIWDDVGHENERPTEVTVSLLRNGTVYDTKTLTKESGWEYTWSGLDASYNWDVSEKEVKGYSSSVRTSGTTLIIVNTFNDVPPTPTGKVTRKAVKIWNDNGYESKRPTEVTVYLLRDGEVYDTKTLSARNGWEYTWTELDPKYTWKVKEKAVEGYSSEIKTYGSTVAIVNTYETPDEPTPETTSRKVVKIWDDAGHENERPTEVTVSLLRNGTVYDTKTLTKESGWEYTWNGLDASYNWDVSEKAVDGYSSSVKTAGTALIIVNKYNKEPPTPADKVTRKAVKIWSDNGYENKRPTEVTVYLLRDGEVYDTKTLSENNGWEYIWTELDPQFTWEIDEKDVDGYRSEVKPSGDTVVIVNTYKVPDKPTPEDPGSDVIACSVNPTAVKRVVGDTPKTKGAFKFLLNAANADCPMPAGANGRTAETTLYGAGKIGFGSITFTEEGTYVYTITEINTAEDGYTYDRTVYTVKYEVVKKGDRLTSTCTITDVEGKESSSVLFTNEYKTPGEKLPQTGVLWWPVPVLLCLGLIFLILGTVLKRRNNER